MNMEPLYAEFEAAKIQGRQGRPLQLVQEPTVFGYVDVAKVARGLVREVEGEGVHYSYSPAPQSPCGGAPAGLQHTGHHVSPSIYENLADPGQIYPVC